MDLARPSPVRELAVKQPDDHYDHNTEREADQHLAVLARVAKGACWADGAPEDRRREEGVDAGACQLKLGLFCAYVLNVHQLEVEHTDAHQRAHKRGHHLRRKGLSGRDLDVVSQFQVITEPDGVRARHVAK